MPEPAADARVLQGRRLIRADPADEGMWRYDLRAATEPHQLRGREVVGVVDESAWYRSHRDPAATVVPHPVPIGQLWVEQPLDDADWMPGVPDQSEVPIDVGRAARLVERLDRPPVRWLRHALAEHRLAGARCCVVTPHGPLWDQRIAGDPRKIPFEDTLNFTRGLESLDDPVTGTAVPVVDEAEWYAWPELNAAPVPVLHAARFVWLE